MAPDDKGRLAARPRDNIHKFGNLLTLLTLVAGGDGAVDAMADMVAQNFLLDPAQGGANRRDLRDDVDTIAILLHHAGQAADLPLDAVKTAAT